ARRVRPGTAGGRRQPRPRRVRRDAPRFDEPGAAAPWVVSGARGAAGAEAVTALDTTAATLSPVELAQVDAQWRAANYLTVGQIYLMANPLLREPLVAGQVKPR